LKWNIHLPTWFVEYAVKFDGDSTAFDSLTDSVAKTGLRVSQELNSNQLVGEAIRSLCHLSNQTLQKSASAYGFDAPRVLVKACYLGIVALKKGWLEVVAELKRSIQEFEGKFFEKHLANLPPGLPPDFDPRQHNIIGLPHHDQLLRELQGLKTSIVEGRSEGISLLEDSELMIQRMVVSADIDSFVSAIWGEAAV